MKSTAPWYAILWYLIRIQYEARKYGKDSELWLVVRKQTIAYAGGRCAITGEKLRILDVHHLYHAATYPQYALDVKMLVPLTPWIHRLYHKENGGTRQPCTPQHFDKWVRDFKKRYGYK